MGFTLVELLVVVAVIAILAAILFPAFAQARAQARKAACISNLRQLGAAFTLYADDYDELLPDYRCDPMSAARMAETSYRHDRFCCGLGVGPGQITFATLLAPMLKSPQVAFCPGDSDHSPTGRPVTSYEYKLWLSEGHGLPEAPSPTGMALLWEQWAYHGTKGSEWERRSAMNILFLDGHVRWKRLSDSSSARYGAGPDLHPCFQPPPSSPELAGLDFPSQ
jgi:prepilin-type N-terminal cleavage/methylation domain-containing protein/prepilin-type processing-associated H-X9-DG protein